MPTVTIRLRNVRYRWECALGKQSISVPARPDGRGISTTGLVTGAANRYPRPFTVRIKLLRIVVQGAPDFEQGL